MSASVTNEREVATCAQTCSPLSVPAATMTCSLSRVSRNTLLFASLLTDSTSPGPRSWSASLSAPTDAGKDAQRIKVATFVMAHLNRIPSLRGRISPTCEQTDVPKCGREARVWSEGRSAGRAEAGKGKGSLGRCTAGSRPRSRSAATSFCLILPFLSPAGSKSCLSHRRSVDVAQGWLQEIAMGHLITYEWPDLIARRSH